ncbi:GATOR complex protein Wdr59 [Condylostylus longicornis]|uniref:GATOR complex protein Wdr59 n=1 Tax=Condylostylus longicornis TaxID=2530218 RepID=UPI00244DCE39|nr:GATOR complex protein Wdr59 [Condylostylus longicornis]
MSLEKSTKEIPPCVVRHSYSTFEHRDSQATAMSVDWTGQWVLLAGRRHLALQRLQNNNDDDCCLQKYHRNSKYDVSACEWAICENSKEYCAIATSQLIEVVTWSSGDPTLIHSLRAHTRMVTDIDWHSREPHLLASCSIDTFTHLWDLRDPRKPTLSLSAVCMSGATQVGFNRVSGNLLATAHDGDLRIWDIRKGSCPIQYITAHLSRIHGINWSYKQETCFTTASQDGTVKYFDVNNPKRAEKIITTASPVWRARFTPIGNGLLTVVVPHLGRGENSLCLWSNYRQSDPICTFVGHTDVILDFAWRSNRNEDSNDLEIITWSRDQTLRLWKIEDQLLDLCEPPSQQIYCDVDEEKDTSSTKGSISKGIDITNNIEYSKHLSESYDWQPTSPQSPLPQQMMNKSLAHSQLASCSLQHEFSLLNTNIPHIDVETLDPVKRYAIFKIVVSQHIVILQVNFPDDYPQPNVIPEFGFCEGTTLDDRYVINATKALKAIALQRVKRLRTCLEQCLRALVTNLKKSFGHSEKLSNSMRLQSPRLEGALTGALHDACVPFPRTSGVRFTNVGYLIHFSQNIVTKRISIRHQQQNVTPRALSAISGGFLGNVMGTQPILYAPHRTDKNSPFYLPERLSGKSSAKTNSKKSQQSSCNIVVNIYDIQKILNINRKAALEYIITKSNILETCRHNKKISERYARSDLIPIWNLAELIASINSPFESDNEMLFYKDPFKRYIVESLIMHFATNGDVQTAAMLCCIFEKFNSYSTDMTQLSIKDGHSQHKVEKGLPPMTTYHTIMPTDSTSSALAMQLKQFRSNSWSDSLDGIDLKYFNAIAEIPSIGINVNRSLFLSKSKMLFFDSLKKLYSEILFSWGLLSEKSLVLKHLSYPIQEPQCVGWAIECSTCGRVSKTSSCSNCHKYVLYCALCRLPVRGMANACLICGHGGHLLHLDQWFKTHNMCPFGCGCPCLERTSALFG